MGSRGQTSGMGRQRQIQAERASAVSRATGGESTSSQSAMATIRHSPMGKQQADAFMKEHLASNFSVEVYDDIKVDGVTFSPISYSKDGDTVYNVFKAQTANSRGEYDVLQIAVKRKKKRGAIVSVYDRSSTGTKFWI